MNNIHMHILTNAQTQSHTYINIYSYRRIKKVNSYFQTKIYRYFQENRNCLKSLQLGMWSFLLLLKLSHLKKKWTPHSPYRECQNSWGEVISRWIWGIAPERKMMQTGKPSLVVFVGCARYGGIRYQFNLVPQLLQKWGVWQRNGKYFYF